MLNVTFVDQQEDLQDVIDYVKTKNEIGLDLETTKRAGYEWYEPAGLDPHTSTIIMLQIGDKECQFVIDTRKVNPMLLKPILEDDSIHKYGVNLKFDAAQLMTDYKIYLKGIRDCMIYEMLLHQGEDTPRGFHGLEQMSERYLGYKYSQPEQTSLFPEMTLYKNIRTEFAFIGNKPFTLAQIIYGATDVLLPLMIKEQQEELLSSREQIQLAEMECKYTEVLARMEVWGLYLDQDKWLDNASKYEAKLQEAEEALRSWTTEHYPHYSEINFNSSKQVGELFLEIGIPIQIVDRDKSTDENFVYKNTVAESHIAKYTKRFDILPLYFEYKHLQKLVTTYGNNWLQYINPVTGRVHSSYVQIINTGRIASREPNLQNIPNEEKRPGFRQCFIAPNGRDMIVCDYSGQESRVLAQFSQDANLVHFFNHGDGDHHSYTASKMFGKPVSRKINKHLRQTGKIMNFSISYGASAHKISDAFQVDKKTAQGLINKFYKAYPELKSYFKIQQSFTLENGYILIDAITKRRSYCRKWDTFTECKNIIEKFRRFGWSKHIPAKIISTYFKLKGEYERNSQNYPIQGSSGSMTKIAAILFDQWVFENNLQEQVHIVNMVHDEIVVESLKKYSDRAAKALEEAMLTAGRLYVVDVPMYAEPVIDSYWTH